MRARGVEASHPFYPSPLCETEGMPLKLPAVIFDLDGTLTDSKPGILDCLRAVLDERKLHDRGPLDRFIGPPVEQWAAELLPQGSEEERTALARDYRACYDREGWRKNAVFPGVTELLAQLHGLGVELYVCTSKQEHFAVRIIEAFGIARYFAAIYGDKAEYASHDKIDLLARVLSEQLLVKESVWMVGDRSFDIEAAHANQIHCIAAAWGYGSAEEWALADAVAYTPAEVCGIVAPAADTAHRDRVT